MQLDLHDSRSDSDCRSTARIPRSGAVMFRHVIRVLDTSRAKTAGHAGDPRLAWNEPARSNLPGPVVYWLAVVLVVVLLIALSAVLVQRLGSRRHESPDKRRRLGVETQARLVVSRWRTTVEAGSRTWLASHDEHRARRGRSRRTPARVRSSRSAPKPQRARRPPQPGQATSPAQRSASTASGARWPSRACRRPRP